MMGQQLIKATADLAQILHVFASSNSDQFRVIGHQLCKSLRNGGKILLCGNGGSASDCQHFAGELVGRFRHDREPLPAIALSADSSVITCIGNDYEYESVYSRQIQALGSERDCVVCISTSGNSTNIIRAIETSSRIGSTSIALLGKGGGLAREIADFSLIVPSDNTARVQECHILTIHCLCQFIESELLGIV